MTDDLRVVDVPRKKKTRAVKSDDAPERPTLTALCLGCHRITGLVKARARVTMGVVVTVGQCEVCKRESYRVGAAGMNGSDESGYHA